MKKITKYLNNQLPEVEDEQITKTLIANHFDRQLEQKWSKILKEQHNLPLPSQKVPKNNFSLYRKIALAAASVAVLLMAIPIYQSSMQPDYDQVLASLSAPSEKFANSTIKKGINKEENSIEENKNSAVNAYSRDNFQQAIPYYIKVTKDTPNLIEDHFFLGLSYFYNNQYEEAIKVLRHANTLNTHDNFPSKEVINWYLGLAYLQNQEIERAKPILQKIATTSITKKRKEGAIKLLKLK